ncbi:FkbM family methyltransferase [Candidatus Wolfebacteria bacterium]|nr:FkbM family methyltransferase [Candidatus Wolfebacteria bacterium]
MVDKICEHTFIKKLVNNNSVVFDLGANTGDFSKIISEKFGCKAYAVEPIPNLFNSIKETELIKKIQASVADKSGIVRLFLPKDRCATMYSKDQELIEKSINVEALSLFDLMNKFGIKKIDLIKIDIEGEEIPILESLDSAELAKISQWTIEFHDFLYPEIHEAVENIKRKFINSGFFCIPFSITNNGDVLFIKNNKISILEFFYLKYIFRYLLGLNRRLNKLLNDY